MSNEQWRWWNIRVKIPLPTKAVRFPKGLVDMDENTATFSVINVPGKTGDIGEVLEQTEEILQMETRLKKFSVEAIPVKRSSKKS